MLRTCHSETQEGQETTLRCLMKKLSTQAYISAKDSLGHVCDKGRVTGTGEMERKLLGHPYVDSWTEFSPE